MTRTAMCRKALGRTAAASALTLAAALVLSGCTGSSIKGSSAPAGGGGTRLPAAASSALAKIAGSGGILDVSKLCAAISQADVQKLFKATAPKVTDNPSECDWGGGAITLDIFQNDTDKQYYSGGGIAAGTSTPLPGVGDQAAWSQPVKGATVPFIAAHKGSTTCTITPGLNVDQSTLDYSGSDPFFKVTDASAQLYATEEGQLCNDMFKAGG